MTAKDIPLHNMALLRSFTLIFALLWALQAMAQLPEPTERTISAQAWKEAIGHLDYSRDVPMGKALPQDLPSLPETPASDEWSRTWVAYVLAGLVLTLLGWLLYRMLSDARNPSLTTDEEPVEVPEDMERRIHSADLETYLRQAIAIGDYRQAARVHFLLVIRHLSRAGAIQWAPHKTNREYTYEMLQHPAEAAFRRAVSAFEHIWYGRAPISRTTYEAEVAPLFDSLLAVRP